MAAVAGSCRGRERVDGGVGRGARRIINNRELTWLCHEKKQ